MKTFKVYHNYLSAFIIPLLMIFTFGCNGGGGGDGGGGGGGNGGGGGDEGGNGEIIFNVEDYGATPNSSIDSGPAIRTAISLAIASGPGTEVHFGPGTFYVGPAVPGNFVFLIDQADNLTISGSGESTEIIVTTPDVHCFLIGNSNEVLLKDLVIDYDPPPFTQGTIIAVNDTNKVFDFEIDPSFPELDESWFDELINRGVSWGMLYDKNERRIKARVSDHFFISASTKIDEMVYRLQVEEKLDTRLRSVRIRGIGIVDKDQINSVFKGVCIACIYYTEISLNWSSHILEVIKHGICHQKTKYHPSNDTWRN